MPELPEVETVRVGLDHHVAGRTVLAARALHPRVARRHVGGGADLCAQLAGMRVRSVERRGKYLWMPVTTPGDDGSGSDGPGPDGSEGGGAPPVALVAHLGMSGQFRVTEAALDGHPHLRFDAHLDDGSWLSFLDQRTFGGVMLEPLVAGSDQRRVVPMSMRHIAVDPFESDYDLEATARALRRRHTEVKRALLDQALVSGIGNIYADEALWRARVHPQRETNRLSQSTARSVLVAAAEVMREALAQGGTSFDALYVNVNGESGYFERSLDAYGREDLPCRRCGAAIRRLSFMNRSSFVCPRCQRSPRRS